MILVALTPNIFLSDLTINSVSSLLSLKFTPPSNLSSTNMTETPHQYSLKHNKQM